MSKAFSEWDTVWNIWNTTSIFIHFSSLDGKSEIASTQTWEISGTSLPFAKPIGVIEKVIIVHLNSPCDSIHPEDSSSFGH